MVRSIKKVMAFLQELQSTFTFSLNVIFFYKRGHLVPHYLDFNK
jgi:hypothetical protein